MRIWSYLCITSLILSVLAIEHPKLKQLSSDIIPGRYIIGFNSNATTLFMQSFVQDDIKIHQQYDHEFFSGISVNIDTNDPQIHKSTLESILDRADVNYVSPVRRIPRPVVIQSKSRVSVLPHHMTQVDLVHKKLNKGKGVLVGILDTGVDYLHPALGGGFGEGYKVSKGYDLVGDAYTGDNAPIPDKDPLDECGAESGASGHGTHVSGIISGYDDTLNFTGVAPEANLAMYRVFGCDGSSGDDVIVKALLMAYDAGADIINLSLGSTNPWADVASDPEIDVVNQIVSNGVHVVISAGNAGASGAYTLSSPSSARGAFSVASVQNQFYNTTTFLASGFDTPFIYSISGGSTAPLVSGDLAVASKVDNPMNDACTAADVSENVKDKVALVKRGTCPFIDKINNVAAAGAIAVIFYENQRGSLTGASAPNAKIASVMISLADGNALVTATAQNTVTINFDEGHSVVPLSDGGSISSFSSTGPSAELVFKPNIAGVGGRVFSTLPRYLGGWGLMSGTSMSSPYVAGSVALYLTTHGKRQSVKYVQEQFQNYASPCPVYKTDKIDNPVRAGAGLVQVYDTIVQGVHVTPSEISFNDTSSMKYKTHTLNITNYGVETVYYKLVNEVSIGVAPYNRDVSGYTPIQPAANVVAKAKLQFSKKAFNLAPGKSQKVKVTVTPPKTDHHDHIYYGGYIALKTNTSKAVHIPYIGVQGKQKDLPIFDEGFPYISDGDNAYGPDDIFTFERNMTRPYTVYRLLTPTQQIKAELLTSKNKVLGHYKTGLSYLSRHFQSETSYYSAFSWDGTYVPLDSKVSTRVAAPAGTFKFRLSALKLFGNPHKPSHWEVFTSGPIALSN